MNMNINLALNSAVHLHVHTYTCRYSYFQKNFMSPIDTKSNPLSKGLHLSSGYIQYMQYIQNTVEVTLTFVRSLVPVQIQTRLILLSSEVENSVFLGTERASEQSFKNEALFTAVAHSIYSCKTNTHVQYMYIYM